MTKEKDITGSPRKARCGLAHSSSSFVTFVVCKFTTLLLCGKLLVIQVIFAGEGGTNYFLVNFDHF